MRTVAFNHVKEKMVCFTHSEFFPRFLLNKMIGKEQGTARPCYTSTLLEDTQHRDEEGVQDTGANSYSAGFDTVRPFTVICNQFYIFHVLICRRYPHS
jgi:hypothetical protein